MHIWLLPSTVRMLRTLMMSSCALYLLKPSLEGLHVIV